MNTLHFKAARPIPLIIVLFVLVLNSSFSQSINYETVNNYLSSIEDSGFSGAVLIAYDNKIEFEQSYGWTDRENLRRNTIHTVFPTGSVSKQFTAAAIIKLEQEGFLRTEDQISKYFNNVPDDKKGITIHQLLTHTSGLKEWAGRCDTSFKLDDFINMIMSSELDAKPGEKHIYSNSGYQLLGALIEKVSQKKYEEYLREKLFVPAQMFHTGIFIPYPDKNEIAIGYRDNERWGSFFEKIWKYDEFPVINHNGVEWCINGSSSILSTVHDLFRWYQALNDTIVLSADSKEKIFKRYVKESEEGTSYYGYGWALFKTARGTNLVAHNGGINNVFQADFRMYTDEKITLIILTNSLYLKYGAIEVGGKIVKLIF